MSVNGLLNGLYDVIDNHISVHSHVTTINDSTEAKILVGYGWEYQEMGLNHYSPIWGMNPHDPREIYPSPPWKLTIPHWFYGLTILSVSTMMIFLLNWRRKKNT